MSYEVKLEAAAEDELAALPRTFSGAHSQGLLHWLRTLARPGRSSLRAICEAFESSASEIIASPIKWTRRLKWLSSGA